MISKITIDQVFDTARVEEVIGDFVQLKKSGSNFKGLSPFTDERTPSFMVSPVKQIWKDFSSGKGGNVVAFLMEHEHFTYPEAIKYLAKKYGIEIEETEQTEEQKEQANERESLYLVNEFARDYFQKTLLETESGKAIGATYFKERGFSLETLKKFQLGYSPDEWDAFTQEALKNGYKLSYLEKTGLSIVKGDKQFDRFKGRVIFPIHSLSGRVLGFGGRILTNDKKAAKYLNSPESEVYHKSKVLYGIYFAKQAIAKEDNCYLVEGYTDVIQFHQTGIENVVSSSGTALTPEQIRLIHRLTQNITLLFDGDAAGLRASLRGVDLILEQGMNVRICTFPEGEDPDSFAKKNSLDELRGYLQENAKDFISFKASLLASEAKNDPIKKAETIRDMVTSISKIPDTIKQEVYLKECSRIMDIGEEVLFSTLAQLLQKDRREASKKIKKGDEIASSSTDLKIVHEIEKFSRPVNLQDELEREIIDILINFGQDVIDFNDVVENIVEEITSEFKIKRENIIENRKVCEIIYLSLQEDEISFANKEFRYLYNSIIETLLQGHNVNINLLMEKSPTNIVEMLAGMLIKYDEARIHDWQRIGIYPKPIDIDIPLKVSSNILRIRHLYIQSIINDMSKEISKISDIEKSEMLKEIQLYINLKKDIAEFLDGPLPQKRDFEIS